MRGYCVLGVFGVHAGYVPFGWVGVQAFFVLSGFLITGILLTAKEYNNAGHYFATFYARRSLRIFPAYYFLILVLAVLASTNLIHGTHDFHQFSESVPYLLSYVENFHALKEDYFNSGFYSHLWTLSIEEQFYLIWPVIIWLTPKRMLIYVCLTVIVFSTFFRAGILAYDGSEHFRYFAAGRISFSHFDAFVTGALINLIPIRKSLLTIKAFGASCAIMLGLGLIILINSRSGYHPPSIKSLGYTQEFPWGWSFVWGYTALNLFVAHLIAILSNEQENDIPPLLGLFDFALLNSLGVMSYGFYLYHDPFLSISKNLSDNFGVSRHITNLGAFVGTLIACYCSYVFIEQPFTKLKQYFFYTNVKREDRLKTSSLLRASPE
jgi:peptidoglycan/LPS O-acetylase OafA/YrhL